MKINKKNISIQMITIVILLIMMVIYGCSQKNNEILEPAKTEFSFEWEKSDDFSKYIKEARNYISQTRIFTDISKKDFELQVNSPFEMKPDPQYCTTKDKAEKGILLIHGLGDSPYSMLDIAKRLSEECFLVRAVLLPGHGNRPGDTLKFSADDWYRVSRFAIKTLKRDAKRIFAGGFSTGANISTDLAFETPEIEGLILFSPAFQLRWEYPRLISFAGLFTDYLFSDVKADDYAKYRTHSINGMKQFYVTSGNIQEKLEGNGKLKIPVFIAMSEDDYVIDVPFVTEVFNNIFSNGKSRMMFFAQNIREKQNSSDQRILTRESYIPHSKIMGFSHNAIPFSPENKHYGKNADYMSCYMSSSDAKEHNKCKMGEDVWFTEYNIDKPDIERTYARLTYNPYFQEMMDIIISTIN